MRETLRAALAVVVVGAATLLAFPASASAASCSAGYICLYEHINYQGQYYRLGGSDDNANFHNHPCTGCISSKHPSSNNTWGDQISSIINNTSRRYCLYRDSGYGGTQLVSIAPPGGGVTNVNYGDSQSVIVTNVVPWVGDYANDEISSARRC
jgi:Peptidase inhibitor family I36